MEARSPTALQNNERLAQEMDDPFDFGALEMSPASPNRRVRRFAEVGSPLLKQSPNLEQDDFERSESLTSVSSELEPLEIDEFAERVEDLFSSKDLLHDKPKDALASPVVFSVYQSEAMEAIQDIEHLGYDFKPYAYTIGSSNIVFMDAENHVMKFNYKHIDVEERRLALIQLYGVEGINYPIAWGSGWSFSRKLVEITFDVGSFGVTFLRKYYNMGLRLLEELKRRDLFYGDWFIDNLGFDNDEVKIIDVDFMRVEDANDLCSHHRHIAKVFNDTLKLHNSKDIIYAFDDACFRADITAMIRAVIDENAHDADIKGRYEGLVYDSIEAPMSHAEIVEALAQLDAHVKNDRKSTYRFQLD